MKQFIPLKSLSYKKITQELYCKHIRFKSDCEFFPNFDVVGKILSSKIVNNEILFKFKTDSGKVITIGSNMKNLRVMILN